MKYETPELVVLGSATVLVQGFDPGHGDNMATEDTQNVYGVLVGLDD